MKPPIAVSILILVLLLLSACMRDPQHYIDSGNRYFEEQRYAEAALEYRNAIQKDTSSTEAHYGLALTQVAQYQLLPAIATLEIILSLNPDHESALASLGDIYLRMVPGDQNSPAEYYEKLRIITNRLLARDPQSYDGLRFQGHLAVIDGKPTEAREFFSQADSIRPDQPNLQLALADALARDNLPEEAEQLALTIIEKHKSFGPAYDFLQLQYLLRRRPDDAERILVLKAEDNPEVADFQLQLAGYYLVAQRTDDGKRIIERLLAEPETFPAANLRIGDLYLRLGSPSDAQRHFEEGFRTDLARSTDYRKRLIRLYWAAGKRSEAHQMAAELVKAAPNDAQALELRASLLLEEGESGDVDQVIADYTLLNAANPQNSIIPYQLGRAHLQKGQIEQAAVYFGEAIKRNETYLPPHLLLAQIRASQGRYGEALHQLDEILAVDSGNTRVRVLRTTTLRNLKRYPEARSELTQLLRGAPEDVDAQVELGMLSLAEGRLNEAETVFGKLYRSKGVDLRPAAGLVQVYSAQGQYEKAIQLLNEEVEKNPASESARQALTTVALRAGDVPLALAQLNSIVALNPQNAVAYVQIGQLQVGQGNVDEGLAALRKAAEIAPEDVNILLASAALMQESGYLKEAEAVLERALTLDSENPVVLNNLAYLLSENGKDLDRALLMATTASQKQSSNRHFLDTLGTVYLKRNMVDNALPIFQSLAAAESSNPTFRMHLGMALLEKGDHSQARKEFQAALSSSNSPEQEKRLRQLLASATDQR